MGRRLKTRPVKFLTTWQIVVVFGLLGTLSVAHLIVVEICSWKVHVVNMQDEGADDKKHNESLIPRSSTHRLPSMIWFMARKHYFFEKVGLSSTTQSNEQLS